jgi:hypothetical protein
VLRSHLVGLASVGLALIVLGPVACGASGPPVYDLSVTPETISPNADGDADVTLISYEIGVPTFITITLDGPAGSFVFRDGNSRSPGHHEVAFGGVIDGHVIPDGTYTVHVLAAPKEAAHGEPTQLDASLTVMAADTQPPAVTSFAVRPEVLSPNQDGIGDRVTISYHLAAPADTRLWLEDAQGQTVTDILEDVQSATRAGEPGPHTYDFDAGVDADAPPPPDGDYRVVLEATDTVGNVTHEERPLRIVDGGLPRAALFGDVAWNRTIVPLGATLTFTVTVRNTGRTPIRTRGPESGFVYSNLSSFNQDAPDELILVAVEGNRKGVARVPIGDRSELTVTIPLSQTNPPTTLPPTDVGGDASADTPPSSPAHGRTVRVCGRVSGTLDRVARVYAFEGDGDGIVDTTTDDAGLFCMDRVAVPAPADRTYARSSGAIRLGLEYQDYAGGLAYPFRWQLGRTEDLDVCESEDAFYLCLLPYREVVVHGGVRFDEAPLRRDTDTYLGLLHEDVRQMDPLYGVERITVEY